MKKYLPKIAAIFVLHILVMAISISVFSFSQNYGGTTGFYFRELNNEQKENLKFDKVEYEITYEFDGYDDLVLTGENSYYYNGKELIPITDAFAGNNVWE